MKRLLCFLWLIFPLQLSAFPAGVMGTILDDADEPLSPSGGTFLKDFDSVLIEPSKSVSVESATKTAITELKTKRADLSRTASADGFVQARTAEQEHLFNRLRRCSRSPDPFSGVGVPPQFGVASIAFSYAVTDVANVWWQLWHTANGNLK